ncbi:MAG: UDP-N-acetylglucosamine 2-epimerase (non-hydrolyzing) [Bryobacteraceae bacterium]
MKILFVFGTRPEAVKLCPVIRELRTRPEFQPRVCVTAQHRHLLDQVLEVFGVAPDHDLDIMTPGQTLFQSTSRILSALEPVLAEEDPDMVLVQGDTTTTFCGALAAFYRRVPVGHVEAGLRTGDPFQPFPEEINRVLTGRLAALHFAATEWAAANLRREGIAPDTISVTGNTGIDAVLHVARGLEQGSLAAPDWPWLDPSRKLIVLTAHRRESFGQGIEDLCAAVRRLAARPDVQIVFPVHPNPNVRQPVAAALGTLPNVHLIDPLSYVPFVDLMRRATLLLTDSGGVQEEGPSLGKPILVLREKTERPEAVEAGTVRLVGTGPDRIVSNAAELLDDPNLRLRMSRVHNPYGDGRSSGRIADLILSFQRKNSSKKN